MRYKSVSRTGDFNRAYRRGKAFVHPHVVLYLNKNRVGYTRVGITASKKVGGAVVRNRARRIIRHALYQVLPQNIGGYDFILVARGQTARLKSTLLAQTLKKLLGQTGLAAFKEDKQPSPAKTPRAAPQNAPPPAKPGRQP